jgi:hypothetical protein
VVATAVAVIALASAIVFPAAVANAAVVDGIDTVTIVAPDPANPGAPLEVNQQFTLDATWSVPDSAQPGDTFGLTFPSPISAAFNQTFDLLSPDGEVVGTCVATGQSITCTLGDYVLTHDGVHGDLTLQAVAVQETTEDELEFETSNGVTITAPIPGGGIVDADTDGPTTVDKYGFMSQDGESVGWTIVVPAAQLPTLGTGVVLTDTYDASLDFDPATVTVGYVADNAWDGWANNNDAQWLPAPSAEWTLVDSPATSSFDLTFPSPEADGWYVVTYYTALPDGVVDGDVFGNTIAANGTTLTEAEVVYASAGGGGDGERRRAISVTKAVDGAGTAPAVDFDIAVACVDGAGAPVVDYPQTQSIAAGETADFDEIPVGSVCTVNETDDGGANNVTYSPSNTVTVTTTSPSVIEFIVTNTFDIPPVPAIDIEKWSTVDGYPAGDYDTAPGKPLVSDAPEAITFTITNTGEEPLVDVVVGDTTQAGPVLTDISCDFSPLGGPATGTTWAGPFAVGATFDCTAMLPGMASNTQHSDTASVDAVGQTSGIPVDDEDQWHGNTPPVPAIDIEKWSTVDGYPAGDYDTAPGKPLKSNTPEKITFTITNTGEEPLVDVVVGDTTQAGPVLTDISCDFSPLGGPATGTTWAGPFAVGATFDCTAMLPGMASNTQHSDTASVDAVGQTSGIPVDDEDQWHGNTPPVPAIDIEKGDTNGNDADTAGDAVALPDGTADLVFTITNTGEEPLVDVTVSDTVISNGVVDSLSCVFPDGSTGVAWAGPFAVGDSFDCTAKLSGVVPGAAHEDVATVTGAGQISGIPVDDEDPYFGVTPEKPALIAAGDDGALALTGAAPAPAAWAGLLTLLLGAGVTLVVAKRRKARTE